jgi:hypothetical protein
MYTTYKTLWVHNKKFHKNNHTTDVQVSSSNVHVCSSNVHACSSNVHACSLQNEHDNIANKKIIKCEYCNKIFSSRSSKSDHKKKACKLKPTNNNELIELKKEHEELQKSLSEIKDLLIKNCKIHPKTLEKINKNLINSNNNNTINNNTINNNNNNNNNTLINKTYVKFYNSVNYKMLSEAQIINIINKYSNSIEESIKIIHFNKNFPEYNNVFITNLKDNTAYIFDGEKFSATLKNADK